MKRTGIFGSLTLIFLSIFFAVYAVPVSASTVAQRCSFTAFGRAGCHGYITNTMFYLGNSGGINGQNILYDPSNHSAMAIPLSVGTNANPMSFVTFIQNLLNGSGGPYNQAGAAFIVDTMLVGTPNGTFGNEAGLISYAKANFAQWQTNILYYNQNGWIQWNVGTWLTTSDINSLHACPTSTAPQNCTLDNIINNTGGSDARDFAFFHMISSDLPEFATEIIVHNPANPLPYILRRECGNLVGPGFQGQNNAPNAHLVASMSTSQPYMSQDDTVNFTPSIGVTNFGVSFTATCTIDRKLYPPTGPTQDLGPQPCVDTSGNSNIPITGNGTKILRQNSYTSAPGQLAGSKICDTMTITSPSGPNTFVRPTDNTATSCAVIAKVPYVWFMGNDVWAGGGFADDPATPCTTNMNAKITTTAHLLKSGTLAGSQDEYGAFALGQIQQFGSASKALIDPAAASGKALTFANVDNTKLGNYGAAQHCINDFMSQFTTTHDPSTNINLSTHASGVWDVSDGTVFGGNVPAGSTQVYIVKGNATIINNIAYPTTYTSAADIPSIIIIATGDITVNSTVKQIDGLYVTKGNFYTCDTKSGTFTVNTCNQQLTINGSVIATTLQLLRTAGADGSTDTSKEQPAELFNMNAEIYLRNALNQGGSYLKTSSETLLPPRY